MIAPPAVVLFDLDGTLTDPYVGIARSFAYAMDAIGRPLPDDYDFAPCIGPPMRDAIARLVGDDIDLQSRAIVAYRERYATVGLFENVVYDGIVDMLHGLTGSFRLLLCTSKPHVFATRILERFRLARFFAATYGAELDGTRGDKSELMAWLLEREHIAPHDAIMVGDRSYDIIAAANNGVAAAGVLWGYGSPGELREAGCTRAFAHPREITFASLHDAIPICRITGLP
jgi:phosphoglycolate phosphatase